MKIEIVKEWSAVLGRIMYRVKLDGINVESFNAENLAMEYIDENKEHWKTKPELIYSEEI